MQVFAVREIANRTVHAKPFVTINTVNPGLCYTDLTRNATGFTYYIMIIMRVLLAWSAEKGARTLVHGTVAGKESHGVFISGCSLFK